jgi:threonine/homoserine/homoserine lactone efflux protein
MTAAAQASQGRGGVRAPWSALGWVAGLLVPLALVAVLVHLDAIDPMVGGLAVGLAASLAWAAIRFARAPLRLRAAPHSRRWRRTGLHAH